MKIIRPGIHIAIVIRLDAIGVAIKLQIDPEADVRENGVAQQGVVNGGGVMHPDPGAKGITGYAAVEGDNVARVRVGAPHGVVVPVNENSARVAQRLCACDIGADDVALDEVVRTEESEDETGVASIA